MSALRGPSGLRLSEGAEDGHALVLMVTGPQGGPYWREMRRFASEATSAAEREDLAGLRRIEARAKIERRRLVERFGCPVQSA